MASREEQGVGLGHRPPSLQIEEIVATIHEVYSHGIGDGDLFIRFQGDIMCLSDLLRLIVSSIRVNRWPMDRDEIARSWHNTILFPSGRRPQDFIQHLPDLYLCQRCLESRLDPRYINLLTEDVEIAPISIPDTDDGSGQAVCRLTHEVMVSTFWFNWYRDIDAYLKRLIIPNTTRLATLLLCQANVGLTGFKYSVTLLPHVHRSGRVMNDPGNGLPPRFLRSPINCTPSSTAGSGSKITCLIWNCQGASTSTMLHVLHHLVQADNPHLIILTQTWVDNEHVRPVAHVAGYSGQIVIHADAQIDCPGMWILWRPSMITVTEKPCFRRCLHVLLQAAETPMNSTMLLNPTIPPQDN